MWVFRQMRNGAGHEVGYVADGRFVTQFNVREGLAYAMRTVNYLNGGDGLAGPHEPEYTLWLREELRAKWSKP